MRSHLPKSARRSSIPASRRSMRPPRRWRRVPVSDWPGHWRCRTGQWQDEYNRDRPHSSLGNLTPAEFAAQYRLAPEPRITSTQPADSGSDRTKCGEQVTVSARSPVATSLPRRWAQSSGLYHSSRFVETVCEPPCRKPTGALLTASSNDNKPRGSLLLAECRRLQTTRSGSISVSFPVK